MSKITPFLEEVVYLVADFLTSIQHNKVAQKLKKQFELPEWVKKDNPLIKKGLQKILKCYVNENEKVLKYYKNRKPESQDQEQSQQEVPTPKPTKKQRKSVSPRQSPLTKTKSPKISTVQAHQPAPVKGWMASQFQQPKRLQDLNDHHEQSVEEEEPEVVIPKKDKKAKKQAKKETSSESEQQTPKPKKQKKEIKKQKKQKKPKGPVDSSYLNSEEQFQLEDKKSKRSVTPEKKSIEKKKVEVPIKNKVEQTKVEIKIINAKQIENEQNETYEQNGYNGPKKFFSRINEKEVGHIPQNRRDNTFEAKARYGVGDAWGQYGHEKLRDTRGDSFKKTKGKLKNKAFQGSGINIDRVNSVPIL